MSKAVVIECNGHALQVFAEKEVNGMLGALRAYTMLTLDGEPVAYVRTDTKQAAPHLLERAQNWRGSQFELALSADEIASLPHADTALAYTW